MKRGICAFALGMTLVTGCAVMLQNPSPSGPPLPIASGQYVFQHRFAEHPDMRSIELRAHIRGLKIRVYNDQGNALFPRGLISEGVLTWHPVSGQWFIAETPEEEHASEVGGCSDGPFVVDLVRRIFWTC